MEINSKLNENIIAYSNEFFKLLKDIFKEKKYFFRLTFIKNEEYNLYTINLEIDDDNKEKENTKIECLTYDELEAILRREKERFYGKFYTASIIGKSEEEFTIKNARLDFLEICDFNYLELNYKELLSLKSQKKIEDEEEVTSI